MFEAIEHYEKAIQLDPDDAIAQNNLGLVKENIGYASKAQVHFKRSNDLFRRKPKKEVSGKRKEFNSQVKGASRLADPTSKPEKIGLNYLEVLKGLFNSSEERKGFLSFLKEYLSPSQDK